MIGEKIINKSKIINTFQKEENILEIKNLSYLNIFQNIDITLKKGEILGLSGLLGSGANEILRCIFGIIEQDSGKILLNNKKIKIKNPQEAVSIGIGYIPSDRKNEGLIQENSVKDNSILTILQKLTKSLIFLIQKKHL